MEDNCNRHNNHNLVVVVFLGCLPRLIIQEEDYLVSILTTLQVVYLDAVLSEVVEVSSED